MKDNEIKLLIDLRFAVYLLGCKKGLWHSLKDNEAEYYMKIVFPKSGTLAYYNLMVNIANRKHAEKLPPDNYGLFNCPIQIEEEATNYFKKNYSEELPKIDNPIEILESLATIPTDSSFEAVYIGQLGNDLESIVRLMAYHYLNIFKQELHSFPYFN